MIYYYHNVKGNEPYIRIITQAMKLDINVSMWFPNTKAKLNQLLKLMEEYDYEGKLPEILIQLSDDLKSYQTFMHREVKSNVRQDTHSNIEQIRIFGGKL